MRTMGSHASQVVVITGASAGVGRATARRFARRGARIALLARGRDALEATRAEVARLGGEPLALSVDVADRALVAQAARRVESELGAIDVWINNAMATVFGSVAEIRPDELRRATEVTYLGTVWGTMAALEYMRQRDRGVVVQVSSALAYRSIPLQSAYCAAKHAVRGFTSSLRTELAHDHSRVRLTMVHLPAVNTPQFGWSRTHRRHAPQPVPPIYQPEVAARAIEWAADHPRRDLFVGFSALRAVWANRLVPGIADWYLARNGFAAQERRALTPADRADNLFEPVEGDRGAHGDFGDVARAYSPQQWVTRHRKALAFAGLLGLALWRRVRARRAPRVATHEWLGR